MEEGPCLCVCFRSHSSRFWDPIDSVPACIATVSLRPNSCNAQMPSNAMMIGVFFGWKEFAVIPPFMARGTRLV